MVTRGAVVVGRAAVVVVVVGKVVVVGTVDVVLVLVVEVVRTVVTTEDDVDEVDGVVVVVSTEAPLEQAVIRHTSARIRVRRSIAPQRSRGAGLPGRPTARRSSLRPLRRPQGRRRYAGWPRGPPHR